MSASHGSLATLFCVEGPSSTAGSSRGAPSSRTGSAAWLCGVAKRTYSFASGRLVLADVQAPLVVVPELEVDGDGAARKLVDDGDLVAAKLATDVVVSGTVWLGQARRRHEIAVAVGESARRLELFGPRRVEVGRRGEVRFTEPQAFDALRLDLEAAYGGYDGLAQEAFSGRDAHRARSSFFAKPGIYAYPRNPIGRGYFIDLERRRADGASLPQIEDPGDKLSPGRFFVPHPRAWLDAPMPGNLGWVPHHFHPRLERLAGPLVPRDQPTRRMRETAFADGADLPHSGGVAARALQGAPPGMAVERLAGDEMVILQGMFADAPELRFHLPGEKPRLTLRVPDLPAASPPVTLQTLRIDLDRRELSLTWLARQRLFCRVPETELVRCAVEVRWSR